MAIKVIDYPPEAKKVLLIQGLKWKVYDAIIEAAHCGMGDVAQTLLGCVVDLDIAYREEESKHETRR